VTDSVAPLVVDEGDSHGDSPVTGDVIEESSWRIFLELLIPFVLAGICMAAAGVLLSTVQVPSPQLKYRLMSDYM